ncbi:hypothetical protein O6H91_03G047600 [Diphasiastrum complanatum]|uniref:Uncharacterized protein n=1 Tax=Diphasiastrum complanatum TaxID=34168 RepID=A0ACC2E6J8_DIPCM|nr:hypothetical protein O6H91_03G047600 [Diphasiastrum complanatum]
MKKDKGKEEVEYKTKQGTAWSHSYLNQKPWHPLSYPNQRRKWIAEQTHAQRQSKTDEVSREFAQEQEFFKQTSLLSKKEKEKAEAMQALSFMYMRPPGYNAESARAAEIADERKKLGLEVDTSQSSVDLLNKSEGDTLVSGDVKQSDGKRISRPKDVFGKTVPTEEEFPVLRNAPRLETGIPGRVKPFAIEVRNVKCARCGAFGHQSGDRECPLKDVIMPQEEARLRRDDPLTTMMTHATYEEPLKWELKHQLGGLSPARGGFKPDDPNQQIIPEDIYDEYGGFLAGGGDSIVSDVLASLSHELQPKSRRTHGKKDKSSREKAKKKRRKSKHLSSTIDTSSDSDNVEKCKLNGEKSHNRHIKGHLSSHKLSKSKKDLVVSSKEFNKRRKH